MNEKGPKVDFGVLFIGNSAAALVVKLTQIREISVRHDVGEVFFRWDGPMRDVFSLKY